MTTIRVSALTGLRFIAAMMVLIGHGWSTLRFTGDTITARILDPLPSLGMTLFFILSGFVMWVNYAESFRERFLASLWRFGVARFARLYPLYLAVGLYVLIRSAWTSKLATFQLPDALLFIPLLQAWVPGSNPASAVFAIPPLGHAWSISVEMFLYLCFPAIALLIIGVRRWATLFALALLNAGVCFLVVSIYVANIPALTAYFAPGMPTDAANMWIGYYSPLTRMVEFISGCIVGAIMMRSREGANPEWHSLYAAASIAGLLLVAALYSTPLGVSHEVLTATMRTVPLACFSYLIWFLARFESIGKRILSASVMLAGGEISYSIYLLHPFVLGPLSKLAEPEMKFSATSFGLWTAIMATAIGATIAISFITWRIIEVPCRRWLRSAAPAIALQTIEPSRHY